MLIELITPLMLATSPMIITVEPTTYNHEQQVSMYKPDTVLSVTYSGTRTFDYKGTPNDSDND